MNEPEFAAYIALDWADRKHYWQMEIASVRRRESGHLDNTPQAIDQWAAGLAQRFPHALLAVCLEQSRGALTWQLTRYPHLVLYPVHPTTVERMRAAFSPSGAKSDPGDAALLLDILLHHRHHLRRLDPDTPETRLLGLLAELRRKLVDERTRQSNRLTASLKMYYPQPRQWIDNIDSPLGCDLLERWPTLQQLQRARPDTLRRFFLEHNCRSVERIQQRLNEIPAATAPLLDPVLLEAGAAAVLSVVPLLRSLNDRIAVLDRRLAELTPQHPESCLFKDLPGAGPVLLPRLIVAFGTQRDRFHSAAELATYSGIAPVSKQSGNSKIVVFRWACPRFLRQTFHEFAACSRARSQWAHTFYQLQRNRGKNHHAAVPSLAFKWIRILFRCWKDHTPYDEARYLRALQLRHSPLLPSDTATACHHPAPDSAANSHLGSSD